MFRLLLLPSATNVEIAIGKPSWAKAINKPKVGDIKVYMLKPSIPIILVMTILIIIPRTLVIAPPINNINVDLINLFFIINYMKNKKKKCVTLNVFLSL